jgi:hypothetical protein
MRNRLHPTSCIVAVCILVAACSSKSDRDDSGVASDGPSEGGQTVDGGLGCCPVGFDLYECQQPAGGTGMACHNPAMGCASSSTCGQGCDPQVTGRCACVQTQLCIVGDHFDNTLCKCVPNLDAAPSDAGRCIDNVLCIQGDHFDTSLCRCVPNGAGTCSTAADCTGALPALCQRCADGGSGCAHFECVAGQCSIAYCP